MTKLDNAACDSGGDDDGEAKKKSTPPLPMNSILMDTNTTTTTTDSHMDDEQNDENVNIKKHMDDNAAFITNMSGQEFKHWIMKKCDIVKYIQQGPEDNCAEEEEEEQEKGNHDMIVAVMRYIFVSFLKGGGYCTDDSSSSESDAGTYNVHTQTLNTALFIYLGIMYNVPGFFMFFFFCSKGSSW